MSRVALSDSEVATALGVDCECGLMAYFNRELNGLVSIPPSREQPNGERI
jgi:hypothetical protein